MFTKHVVLWISLQEMITWLQTLNHECCNVPDIKKYALQILGAFSEISAVAKCKL